MMSSNPCAVGRDEQSAAPGVGVMVAAPMPPAPISTGARGSRSAVFLFAAARAREIDSAFGPGRVLLLLWIARFVRLASVAALTVAAAVQSTPLCRGPSCPARWSPGGAFVVPYSPSLQQSSSLPLKPIWRMREVVWKRFESSFQAEPQTEVVPRGAP